MRGDATASTTLFADRCEERAEPDPRDAVRICLRDCRRLRSEYAKECCRKVDADRCRQTGGAHDARIDLDELQGTGVRIATELDCRDPKVTRSVQQPGGRFDCLVVVSAFTIYIGAQRVRMNETLVFLVRRSCSCDAECGYRRCSRSSTGTAMQLADLDDFWRLRKIAGLFEDSM
jgi:hypothetical protein